MNNDGPSLWNTIPNSLDNPPDKGQHEALLILMRAWSFCIRSETSTRSALSLLDRQVRGFYGEQVTTAGSDGSNYREFANFKNKAMLDDKNEVTRLMKFFINYHPQNIRKATELKGVMDQRKFYGEWTAAWNRAARVFDLKRAYDDFAEDKFDASLDAYSTYLSTRLSIASLCRNLFRHDRETFNEIAENFGATDSSPASFACFRHATTKNGAMVRTRMIIYAPDDQYPYCRFENVANPHTRPRDSNGVIVCLSGIYYFIGKMNVDREDNAAKILAFTKFNASWFANGLALTRATKTKTTIVSRSVLVRETENFKDGPRRNTGLIKPGEISKNLKGIDKESCYPRGEGELSNETAVNEAIALQIEESIKNVDLTDDLTSRIEKADKKLFDELQAEISKAITIAP